MDKPIQALQWTGDSLQVLDQRLLPETLQFNQYHTADEVADAIATMQVRGAPAIGIAAGYGVALSVRQHYAESRSKWQDKVYFDISKLAQSRPTAVNLFWVLKQMKQQVTHIQTDPVDAIVQLACQIHADDITANQRMGQLGASLLQNAKIVMTHCNAGSLATGGYGTALGVIRSAYFQGQGLEKVYVGETRPWLQGTRLTVWELVEDNIPVTLIADSAAAWLMQSGKLDWIIVGADRIAANGDVANKIGTYSLAVMARQHQVNMMVVAPLSTIDFSLSTGNDIVIEQRNTGELLPECYHQNSIIDAWNPVFDVTPASLVTAIVTEKGVIQQPTTEKIKYLQ